MRTTNEIVADAKDGKIPTHEECFWAMLALSGRMHFFVRDLEAIGEALDTQVLNGEDPTKRNNKILLRCAVHIGTQQKVRKTRIDFGNKSPQEWLGDSGNPFHPDTIKFMDMGKKLLDNAMAQIAKAKK